MADNTLSMIAEIASLSRDQLVERLLHHSGHFAMDFTPEYLASKSDSQLRHILIAALKHNGAAKQK